MPLILEDGTGVVGANSYITIDELRTYALDRGVPFTAAPTDPAVTDPATAIYTPFLIRACDYIESKQSQFQGYPTTTTQTLCFPRSCVFISWNELPIIPLQLKSAQAQLVLEQLNGIALFPSQPGSGFSASLTGPNGVISAADGRVKIREKLDVIEDEWSNTQGVNLVPFMAAVDAYLNVLYGASGQFFTGERI